jgi:hypothetical protein
MTLDHAGRGTIVVAHNGRRSQIIFRDDACRGIVHATITPDGKSVILIRDDRSSPRFTTLKFDIPDNFTLEWEPSVVPTGSRTSLLEYYNGYDRDMAICRQEGGLMAYAVGVKNERQATISKALISM